jgi:hypothetical protein
MREIATVLAALGLFLLGACTGTHEWIEKAEPWTQETIAHADRVRIHRRYGGQVVLERPRIDRDERGEFIAGHAQAHEEQEIRIEMPDVQSLEVWAKGTRNVAAEIAAGIVIAGAIILLILHGSSAVSTR